MNEIRYTLLADGSSDQLLLPILSWLLRGKLPNCAVQSQCADLGSLRKPPIQLSKRIEAAVDYYPCDILFIHRDAERCSPNSRKTEIEDAVRESGICSPNPHHVCVIPVRMQEAWFLFDSQAIRSAAGNPNGSAVLTLPALKEVENLPDPKDVLHNALRTASELRGRRLKDFRVRFHARRLADVIDDFAPLRAVPAFLMLEGEVKRIIDSIFSTGSELKPGSQ